MATLESQFDAPTDWYDPPAAIDGAFEFPRVGSVNSSILFALTPWYYDAVGDYWYNDNYTDILFSVDVNTYEITHQRKTTEAGGSLPVSAFTYDNQSNQHLFRSTESEINVQRNIQVVYNGTANTIEVITGGVEQPEVQWASTMVSETGFTLYEPTIAVNDAGTKAVVHNYRSGNNIDIIYLDLTNPASPVVTVSSAAYRSWLQASRVTSKIKGTDFYVYGFVDYNGTRQPSRAFIASYDSGVGNVHEITLSSGSIPYLAGRTIQGIVSGGKSLIVVPSNETVSTDPLTDFTVFEVNPSTGVATQKYKLFDSLGGDPMLDRFGQQTNFFVGTSFVDDVFCLYTPFDDFAANPVGGSSGQVCVITVTDSAGSLWTLNTAAENFETNGFDESAEVQSAVVLGNNALFISYMRYNSTDDQSGVALFSNGPFTLDPLAPQEEPNFWEQLSTYTSQGAS